MLQEASNDLPIRVVPQRWGPQLSTPGYFISIANGMIEMAAEPPNQGIWELTISALGYPSRGELTGIVRDRMPRLEARLAFAALYISFVLQALRGNETSISADIVYNEGSVNIGKLKFFNQMRDVEESGNGAEAVDFGVSR